MIYRELGKTGLSVSEIGLGGEWLARHTTEEVKAVIDRCEEYGINILDCFMSGPKVRSDIGAAIRGKRDKWIIEGHIGSAHRDGQYVRTREMDEVRAAFDDLLTRLETDFIDIGMIHFVDRRDDWERVLTGGVMEYAKELKAKGVIGHIGLSTHNPDIARMAAEGGDVEVILFSMNPAYDMLPATEVVEDYFADEYDASLGGITKERAELYRICEARGVGITVMKAYGGGRLLDEKRSPFGAALTAEQCIHYCLTTPAVGSVLVGCEEVWHVDVAMKYETATDEQKDYATVLANAPRHAYAGQCTYCGHCKPCPVDIDIAMVNKYYDLATVQNEVPASVRDHYEGLEVHADACIGCGACEERCPFGVKISERMTLAAELFK